VIEFHALSFTVMGEAMAELARAMREKHGVEVKVSLGDAVVIVDYAALRRRA